MNIEISPKEYEGYLNWDDANMYCQLLVIDGKNDWRLPSLEELSEIYISRSGFFDGFYWSSLETGEGKAWGQLMITGSKYTNDKKFQYSVIAVRTI